MSARPVTISTVAKAANCAVSTVSRALRDDPKISDRAKDRVRQVAAKLNYQPLRRRRSVSEKQEKTARMLRDKQLLLLTLGMDRSLVSLPAVSNSISGVENALSGLGLHLQIAHVPDLFNVPEHIAKSTPDGVFLIGADQGRMLVDSGSALLRQLRGSQTVWLLGRPQGCWGDSIGANDILIGQMAADYLADHGHQHVAFVNPKPDHLLLANRETGFLAQAQQRDLRVRTFSEAPAEGWSLPLKVPMTIASVQHLIDHMLKDKQPPTALFAASDSIAAVVYGALARRGVNVGDEISIISGNNDQALIAGLHPALTTYDIHAHDIGRLAVHQMESRLRMKASSQSLPDVDLLIDPHLVEGNSVRILKSK